MGDNRDPHNAEFNWHCPQMGPGLNTTRANCLQRQNEEEGCMYMKCKPGKRLWDDDFAPAHLTQTTKEINHRLGIQNALKYLPGQKCCVPGCKDNVSFRGMCKRHGDKQYRLPGKCLGYRCDKDKEGEFFCSSCDPLKIVKEEKQSMSLKHRKAAARAFFRRFAYK